jgi:hypothetical protein
MSDFSSRKHSHSIMPFQIVDELGEVFMFGGIGGVARSNVLTKQRHSYRVSCELGKWSAS